MANDLPSSKSLRAGLRAAGKLDRWDNEKRPTKAGYPPEDVQQYAVQDSGWQEMRHSMKGLDTVKKLRILEYWWDEALYDMNGATFSSDWNPFYPTEVQIGNYLGALRRGGQLDNENRIRKAR